jgi:hypothetical protein
VDQGGIPIVIELLSGTEALLAQTRVNAATTIQHLSQESVNHRQAITQAGAIKPLIEMVSTGKLDAKIAAAGALMNLALHYTQLLNNRLIIAKEGGIKPLVALLAASDPKAQEHAAGAIMNLANEPANRVTIAELNGIAPLVALVKTAQGAAHANAITALRNLALENANRQPIADTGAIELLIPLVKAHTDATRTLNNLGLTQRTGAAIVGSGAVPVLVDVLQTEGGSETSKEFAAAALWTLAIHKENRPLVATQGAIPPLIQLLKKGSKATQGNAERALRALARDNEANRAAMSELGYSI